MSPGRNPCWADEPAPAAPQRRVLSLQSAVADGRVGNTAAAFALERLGVEVVRLDTVAFSNHPGHGAFRGAARPPEEVAALVEGLAAHGTLARLDALLVGYLGAAGTAAVAADLIDRARAAGLGRPVAVDPVIGDDGRIFVADGVPQALRDSLLPRADIVTPNAFELGWLTDRPVVNMATADAAARALIEASDGRPAWVVVTGVADGDGIAVVAAGREAAWAVTHPRVDTDVHGTGDLFAALFLARWLTTGGDVASAASLAVAGLLGVLEETARRALPELALVAAQDLLAVPRHYPPVRRLR